MTNTEWLRRRVEAQAEVGHAQETLEELKESEWSEEFETLMRNRLLVGRFRYGRMDDPKKGNYDHIGSMLFRLALYQQDGNKEHLVDIANLALIEFVHTKHPNAHFDAQDDGEHHCKPL